MKITIEKEDGQSQVLEGLEADNFAFFAMAGNAVFHMPVVMSLCGHPTFAAHAEKTAGDRSFAQMLLRAIREDKAEYWNDLLAEHYGGEDGFQAMKKRTLDDIRVDPVAAKELGLGVLKAPDEVDDGPACVELT